MNNEKVASLWADKNVTLNTKSSFNGLIYQNETNNICFTVALFKENSIIIKKEMTNFNIFMVKEGTGLY